MSDIVKSSSYEVSLDPYLENRDLAKDCAEINHFPNLAEIDAIAPDLESISYPLFLYLALGSHVYRLGNNDYRVSLSSGILDLESFAVDVDKRYKIGNNLNTVSKTYKLTTTNHSSISNSDKGELSLKPSLSYGQTLSKNSTQVEEVVFTKTHQTVKAIANNRWRIICPEEDGIPFEGILLNYEPFCVLRSLANRKEYENVNRRSVKISLKVRSSELNFVRVSPNKIADAILPKHKRNNDALFKLLFRKKAGEVCEKTNDTDEELILTSIEVHE